MQVWCSDEGIAAKAGPHSSLQPGATEKTMGKQEKKRKQSWLAAAN